MIRTRKAFDRILVHNELASADLISRLWDDADALVDNSERLIRKQCVRTTVRVSISDRRYVVKRYVERSWRHQFKQYIRRSRAERCWIDTSFLHSSGYPTPSPVAYFEHRMGPFRGRSFFVYEFVAGETFKSLATGLRNQRLLRRYVLMLVDIWARHKALAVSLSDGHPANFIVDAAGKMWVIDLDKLKYFRSAEKLDVALRRSFRDTIGGVIGDRSIIEFGLRKLNARLAGGSLASVTCDAHPVSAANGSSHGTNSLTVTP